MGDVKPTDINNGTLSTDYVEDTSFVKSPRGKESLFIGFRYSGHSGECKKGGGNGEIEVKDGERKKGGVGVDVTEETGKSLDGVPET